MSQGAGFGQGYPNVPPPPMPPGMGPVGGGGFPPNQMPPGGMPPQGMPPGGYGGGGYSMPPMRRTSAAAVVSLVFGLILCIPYVTGLVAVITGIVGIASTRNPAVRGRVLAIIGLLLGIVNLIISVELSLAVRSFYVRDTTAEKAFVSTWIGELAANDVTGATKDSALPPNSPGVQTLATATQSWGTFQNVTPIWAGASDWAGHYFMLESGTANFSGGPHPFIAFATKDNSGALKIQVFQWTH
jgi:hypothetical protein